MKIIVHYPAAPSSQENLSNRIADIHAQAVIAKLKQHSSSTDEKLQFLDSATKKMMSDRA